MYIHLWNRSFQYNYKQTAPPPHSYTIADGEVRHVGRSKKLVGEGTGW